MGFHYVVSFMGGRLIQEFGKRFHLLNDEFSVCQVVKRLTIDLN